MIIQDKKGRFDGALNSLRTLRFRDVLKWKLLHPYSLPKPHSKLVVKEEHEKLISSNDYLCWFGHASFLLQLGGKHILIDPVFGDIPFYKRDIPAPYTPAMLPNIDFLLLSHTHYDHFDASSLMQIGKYTKQALLPLQMGRLLKRTVKSDIVCTELNWFERYEKDDLAVTLVPAKHWSRRGIFDTNVVLWGGFVIEYMGKTIYFAGDTAFDTHFEAIGSCFDIDIAILPIGAYRPREVMKHNHLNPQEAYDAFKMLGAKQMIPMHYGTFKLSDEPLDEPLAWLRNIADSTMDNIKILDVGEVYTI